MMSLLLLSGVILSVPSGAQENGEYSVLLISNEAGSQPSEAIMRRLNELSSRYGKGGTGLPLRQIDRQYPEGFEKLLTRLGLENAELPVLGVVLWNKPESLGPRRFVGEAFARRASKADVPRVTQSYLRLAGRSSSLLPPFFMVDHLPIAKENGLQFQSSRFESSGHPIFVTNIAARITNDSFSTIRDINVRFYVRINPAENWRRVGTKVVPKIASHQAVSADFIADTRKLNLLDANNNAVRCHYRIEIEIPGTEVQSKEGVFVPSEEPIS